MYILNKRRQGLVLTVNKSHLLKNGQIQNKHTPEYKKIEG